MGYCRLIKIPVYGLFVKKNLFRYYRDADVVMLVFDLTDLESFKQL